MLTADGEPTTDPKQAEILLPLGGPKGSGLGLMFEMLASILASAPIQARALGPEKRDRHTGNTAMLAIDIETFRPLAGFTHDADALTAILKALPRQAGFDEVTMPGERSQRTEAKPQERHSRQTLGRLEGSKSGQDPATLPARAGRERQEISGEDALFPARELSAIAGADENCSQLAVYHRHKGVAVAGLRRVA